MPTFLRTRRAFFAIVVAASVAPAVYLLGAGQEEASYSLLVAGGLVSLLILALGVWRAHKMGTPALPPAATLWWLLLAAAACVGPGHLYAFFDTGLRLPLALFLTMGCICVLWAALGRFSLLLWWPFLALEMAQRAGYEQYGARINSLVLAETFEASGDEVWAYFSPWNIGICLAVMAASAVLCRLLALILKKQSRLSLLNLGMIWGGLACLFGAAMPPAPRTVNYYWPIYEAQVLQQAWSEALNHNQATIHLVEQLSSPAEQPSALHSLRGGEGVVLVLHIGESLRADRMSINGYERDTTPWLRCHPRLVNFPRCISAACDTCQSQIAILTDARRNIYDHTPEMQPHTGSVLDLFAANGFKVYSFFGKRNGTHLKYDFVVRLLTRCAKERFHAPGSPWSAVPQMAELLQRTNAKDNIILFINNEGSHTPFSHYDRENPPYTPIGSSFARPSAHAEEVNNAYDATVHYTDEFVRRVTQLLRGRPWIYLYVSDHGEYLGHDGIWGRAGLGESKRQYHSTSGCRVGMFVLTSPELEQVHPHFASALAALQEHSGMTVGHEHIFHTLLGFFDLRSPHYKPSLDLCSDQAEPYTGPQPEQ